MPATKYDLDGIAKAYKDGMIVSAIAVKFGCYRGTVESVRRARGIAPRQVRYDEWCPTVDMMKPRRDPLLVFKEGLGSVSVVLEKPGDSKDSLCGEVRSGKLTLYVEPGDGGIETHLVNLTLEGTKKLLLLLTKDKESVILGGSPPER